MQGPYVMDKTDKTIATKQIQHWSQRLQRRIMRLLLQHDEPLFHNQFRQFYVNSSLPQIPLLQQYDRYIKLRGLSDELLDDILPRIRRQLSLKTSRARLREEAPTRGDIDWPAPSNAPGAWLPAILPFSSTPACVSAPWRRPKTSSSSRSCWPTERRYARPCRKILRTRI